MSGNNDFANKNHRTIFAELLESDLPESEKSIDHLTGEAQLILAAGSVTTAHTLAVATYHLLANPEILARVRKELAEVMPQSSSDPPSLQQLESLPYFVSSPTPLLSPNDLQFPNRQPAYKKVCACPTVQPVVSHGFR